MSLFSELESLVKTLPRDVQLAKGLEKPNVEDDLPIKHAMVGFSYNSATQNWTVGHFEAAKRYLDSNYDDDELKEYGDNAEVLRQFAALAYGYLLRRFQEGQVNDSEFRVAELQIPGIVMLHLPTLLAYSI